MYEEFDPHKLSSPPRPENLPTIAEAELLFSSVEDVQPHIIVSSEAKFKRRLAICRACPLWLESKPFEHGACGGHPKLIWRELGKCPENKWSD